MPQAEIDQAEWNNPENWVGDGWFKIYFSKADSRVWVPRSEPSWGWTPNFAHPTGVKWMFVSFLGTVLLLVGVMFLIIASCGCSPRC